ncbi:hypothetical protein NW762_008437 [Fusarium torreyae]|uniref:FAD dependent oxidoreductase domain-containing protein n=1 Tax=Fusarium torreyae TaxID=1237075 RepID=A0A9W8RXR1_9HYPO|nr:hypothetical protein NW762_008437 [Fusarium torreyae]
MAPSPGKTDPIIIVGAGIFGLSTAIHLAQRGYTNVTVSDKQPYEKTLYSYTEGCDAASADINKILRSAYGSQTEPPSSSRTKGQGSTDETKKALGVLDTTGGYAVADKACRFALHKAKSLGVNSILDPTAGRLTTVIQDSGGKVTGIRTADGKSHTATATIIAAGGWTPTLVPSLDSLAETTAGSVIILKIPESSPLRKRFSPENFLSYSFNMQDGAEGEIYGFPVDENGYLKIGYRRTKYTNPKVQSDGRERSQPITRWTEDERITKIPEQALKVFRRFLDDYLSELGRRVLASG